MDATLAKTARDLQRLEEAVLGAEGDKAGNEAAGTVFNEIVRDLIKLEGEAASGPESGTLIPRQVRVRWWWGIVDLCVRFARLTTPTLGSTRLDACRFWHAWTAAKTRMHF